MESTSVRIESTSVCIESNLDVYRNDFTMSIQNNFDLHRNDLYQNDFVSKQPDTLHTSCILQYCSDIR